MKFPTGFKIDPEKIGPFLQKVLETAVAKATEMKHDSVTLGHVLFAVFATQGKDWIMNVALTAEKIDPEKVAAFLEALLGRVTPAEEPKNKDEIEFTGSVAYALQELLKKIWNQDLQVSRLLQGIWRHKELEAYIQGMTLFDPDSFLATTTLAEDLSAKMFRGNYVTDIETGIRGKIALEEAMTVEITIMGKKVNIHPLLAGILNVSLASLANERERTPVKVKDRLIKLLPAFSAKAWEPRQ